MADNNYLLAVRCKNCNHNYEASIPKEMKYENVKCKFCGLKELEKSMPNQFGIDPTSFI